MTNYPVNRAASQISDANFSDPFAIRNLGETDIYLGNDSSLTAASSGWVLKPGEGLQWSGTSDLFACTLQGESLLGQLYEGTGVFTPVTNVSVTGPVDIGEVTLAPGSEVTVSGPVAVTGDVNVAGSVSISNTVETTVSGPVTVAGSVAISGGSIGLSGPVTIDGDVNVDGSTINVGNAVQSKYITKSLIVVNSSTVPASGVAPTIVSTTAVGLLDGLTSLKFYFGPSGSPATTFSIASQLTYTISWSDDNGTFIAQQEVTVNRSGIIEAVLPILGTRFSVNVTQNGTNIALAVQCLISGTNVPLKPRVWTAPSTSQFNTTGLTGSGVVPVTRAVNDNFAYVSANVASGGDGWVYFSSLNGRAHIVVAGDASVTSRLQLGIYSTNGLFIVVTRITDPITSGGIRYYETDVNVPQGFLAFHVFGTTAAASVNITITWEQQ